MKLLSVAVETPVIIITAYCSPRPDKTHSRGGTIPARPSLFLRYLLISFRAFLLSDVLNRHVEVFPVDVVPYM